MNIIKSILIKVKRDQRKALRECTFQNPGYERMNEMNSYFNVYENSLVKKLSRKKTRYQLRLRLRHVRIEIENDIDGRRE